MKIYLDDVRDLPKWMREEGEWIVVRSGEEFLSLLEDHTLAGIQAISFDNDMGEGKLQGWQVLDKIEQEVYEGMPSPELYVHSGNPVAAKRMLQTVWSIQRFVNDREES